ncbi:hypothetical protein HWV62_4469 [Athelia sp. TMB]|nr:hypothetical protein HWV62_4469 [Athelia sp. TMB]
MDSAHRVVPLFSGQGADAANAARTRAQGIRDASSPGGSVLVNACFDAFREEMAQLSPQELLGSEISLDDLHAGINLLETSPDAIRNPILSGLRLFLFQTLRYLHAVENSGSSQTRFRDALVHPGTQSLGVLGFSSGLLAACVVASSPSLPAFIFRSVEAFRLAFWIGFRTQEYRNNALKNTDSAARQLPWSVVLLGLDQDLVEEAIENFRTQNACAPSITAVTAPRHLTVSGHPIELQSFCAGLPSTCTIHNTTLSTLYHSSAHLAFVREQIQRDVISRGIKFPELSDLLVPIRSTYTGHLLDAEMPGSLVELVLDMLLIHPVDWERTVATLKHEAGVSSLRLVNYGPGSSLMKVAEKAIEGTGSVAIDMSLEREQEADERQPKHEPIAIVGMAVNMPGAPDQAKLWEVLEQGINTCTEIPESRFKVSDYLPASSTHPGRTMSAHTGNFIASAGSFDAKFFKISPREARSMDPQQRVLLHVAYEALENAGYVPDSTPSWQRDSIGCYVGAATRDYAHNLRSDIDVYYSTGTLAAFLSGRISYVMQLGGPSITVDTACSSSTVAIYQACRAISAGDCRSAIAGGVNVITSPDMMLGLDRGHFLSPTGQCKAFDASADGYSRSEGCGMFVLKKLSDAVAENDNILGVIRSIEVNQSGMASSITHPHPPSQIQLFKRVMDNAGVDASCVSVVEAHGTGTQAGDPCELESIRAVFSSRRSAQNPLHITSIKANIGHLEAASGAAGLAKLLLMLQRSVIPRQILLNELNPKIAPLGVDHTVISTSQVPWLSHGGSRFALLNNFGAAGSNAALLLEEYQTLPAPAPSSREHVVFGISAKTEKALASLRSSYISWLRRPENANIPLTDIAYTATARRQIYEYRLALSVTDKQDLADRLGSITPTHVSGCANGVVFVFSGQGSQYLGMGALLYQSCPLFRLHIDECNRILAHANFADILCIITALSDVDTPGLSCEATLEAYQTSILAIEYSLAKLWMSWGITPVAVVGHSLGEYAALVIAGVIQLGDALKLVARRARLMLAKCPLNSSGMLAVKLPGTSVASLGIFGDISIACYNSSTQCVVSGAIATLRTLKSRLDGDGHKSVLLDVPFGYHGLAMQPILADLTTAASQISFSAPRIPVVSNVHGKVITPGDASTFNAEYIALHCIRPVLFEQALTSLLAIPVVYSAAAWIELGPDTTVLPMLRSHQGLPNEALLLGSLRKSIDPWKILYGSLEKLYISNVGVRWREVYAHNTCVTCVNLPPYQFDKIEYWVDFKEESLSSSNRISSPIPSCLKYTMLDSWLQYPSELNARTAIFTTPVMALAEFIKAHVVGGFPLCPASVYLELIYSGAALSAEHLTVSIMNQSRFILHAIKFINPLVYVDEVSRTIKTTICFEVGRKGFFIISSQLSGDGADLIHAEGTFTLEPISQIDRIFSRALPAVSRHMTAAVQPVDGAHPETFSTRTAYDLIFSRVVDYGAIYRAMQTLTVDSAGMEAVATIRLPQRDKQSNERFYLNPIFSDAMLHVAGFVANMQGALNDVFICTAVGTVHIFQDLIDESASYSVYCCNSWIEDEGVMLADTYALQRGGLKKIVAHIKGLEFRRVRLDTFKRGLSVAAGVKHPRIRSTSFLSNTTIVNSSPPSPLKPSKYDPSPLTRLVAQIVADACLVDAVDIDPDADLSAIGVDSLMSIEILMKLQKVAPGVNVDLNMLGCSSISQIVSLMRPLDERRSPLAPISVIPDPDSRLHCVKEIFASVLGLGLEELDENTELDCLGLDSLSTIEAIHSLENKTGRNIPCDFFQTHNTVHSVQAYLSDSIRPHSHTIASTNGPNLGPVPKHIQTTRGGAPLFLIHDGSGMASYYERLRELGRDVWTIHNPHFSSEDPWPWADIESMANEYKGYITDVSSGPVLVGGWSFGGVVAFELARQLLRIGTDARVILIDSPSPTNHVPLHQELLERILTMDGQSNMAQRIRTQFRFNSKALGTYNPSPSDGPFPKIILLRSSEGFKADGLTDIPSWLGERADPHDSVSGWEALLGSSVRVCDIPGHHFEPFSPPNIDEVSVQIVEACSYLERRRQLHDFFQASKLNQIV